MSLFNKIENGLNEAMAYERGEIEARVSRGYVAPLESFLLKKLKKFAKARV